MVAVSPTPRESSTSSSVMAMVGAVRSSAEIQLPLASSAAVKISLAPALVKVVLSMSVCTAKLPVMMELPLLSALMLVGVSWPNLLPNCLTHCVLPLLSSLTTNASNDGIIGFPAVGKLSMLTPPTMAGPLNRPNPMELPSLSVAKLLTVKSRDMSRSAVPVKCLPQR